MARLNEVKNSFNSVAPDLSGLDSAFENFRRGLAQGANQYSSFIGDSNSTKKENDLGLGTFRQDLMTAGNAIKEDMMQNPASYVPMGSVKAVGSGSLDEAYLAGRKAIDKMSLPQLYERTATNYPKPSKYYGNMLSELLNDIKANKIFGSPEKIAQLEKQADAIRKIISSL